MRKHVTYANVVSTLCLFAILGGGAYAATGGPDHNRVFHGCVSSTGALRMVGGPSSCRKARRHGKHRVPGETAISWNQQGPAGQGLPGQNGASGATKVIVRTAQTTGQNGASVDCLPGERATGGGGAGSGPSDPLTVSSPLANGSSDIAGKAPNGWETISTLGSGTHTAFVVCASP